MAKQEKSAKQPLRRRLTSWTLQLAGFVLILFLIHLWQTRNLVEGVAPTLMANTLNGLPVDLTSYSDGPVLLHFWATWCPVCKVENSTIDQLSEDHSVLTVAMQSGSDQEVSDYLKEHELGFKTINDPSGKLSSLWRVKGLPTSLIIDKDRNIRFVSVGYTPELTLRLRLWLAELDW
ncbi:MAG: protein disulfide oxidoreductase [Candidatus Thiodiazotropha sp. 6PLUC5]